MLELFRAKLTPNRQKCCLLSWRVLQSAVHSPIDRTGGDGNRPTFSGPDLAEEES
jgi:nitrogen fixation NifU-like protein